MELRAIHICQVNNEILSLRVGEPTDIILIAINRCNVGPTRLHALRLAPCVNCKRLLLHGSSEGAERAAVEGDVAAGSFGLCALVLAV